MSPSGRKAPDSSPKVCSCCSHWQSTTSVLRPDTFLMRRGVHQHHLKPTLFQHPEQWYPVHAGGLHDHGLHAALGQPVRQTIQVRREGGELAHRRLRAVGGHRHEVAAGSHVDARRVQVYLSQLRGQTLPPLLQSFPPGFALLSPVGIISPYHGSVGASPEGATDSSHSPERDRPHGDVTNDAAVRLPDHALYRAICTKV